MYKQDSIQQVLLEYKITITDRKMSRQRKIKSYSQWNVSDLDPYNQLEEEVITVFTADIPEKEFTAMADALCEIRDLMRDPETARLLMEARFINRLKGRF